MTQLLGVWARKFWKIRALEEKLNFLIFCRWLLDEKQHSWYLGFVIFIARALLKFTRDIIREVSYKWDMMYSDEVLHLDKLDSFPAPA